MPHVVLTQKKRIRKKGVSKTYFPGDTVEVGRQQATAWILDRTAQDPFKQLAPTVLKKQGATYGVIVLADKGAINDGHLSHLFGDLPIVYKAKKLPYDYTFVYLPSVKISHQLLSFGWLRIAETGWDMAARLVNLKATIGKVGTKEEQALTKKMIGDLRLPVYESGLLWFSRSSKTQDFYAEYASASLSKTNRYHVFLRTLYHQRPLLCTLPLDWV